MALEGRLAPIKSQGSVYRSQASLVLAAHGLYAVKSPLGVPKKCPITQV